MTPEEMIQRARDLVPRLRERASACEALRRVPDETVQDFLDAGLFRIVQPRRFGGYEFDLPTMVRCMIEISRGCGSSGWVLSLTAAHTWWAAQYAPDAQNELFADGGDLRFPLIFAPTGQAMPVGDGYNLTGTWNYASGCEMSNWVAVNAIVPGETDGAPPSDLVVCLIRASEYKIVDNWHVMGLCN
ncbi:MAG: acyl-CoA dehydrogenase family protein, partial [Alphaproteobacteria bacterium]|nr:acyl-CoA dehydrogenase family protein [Alphaproteobacteria bacterium]